MRWTLGIVGALAAVVTVNMLFLYLALENPDQVVPSYESVEKR